MLVNLIQHDAFISFMHWVIVGLLLGLPIIFRVLLAEPKRQPPKEQSISFIYLSPFKHLGKHNLCRTVSSSL